MPLTPPPTSIGYLPGANSARSSAAMQVEQNAGTLNALNKISTAGSASKGGKHRRRKGGDGKVVVSMPQPLYSSVSSPAQSAPGVTMKSVGLNNQALTNNDFFKNVAPAQPIPPGQLKGGSCGCDFKGGRKRVRTRKGGTRIMGPNQTWGCYSGGKRKRKIKIKTRKTNKRRKSRSTRRR